MATHYEVLGVPKGSSAAQIREAYRARARVLHPDRMIDASPREQDEAATQMRRVNEAWRILGDVKRRRTYDESLAPAGTRHYADTTLGLDEELGGVPGTVTIMRALPWLLLVVALGVIFVFTAYAGPGSDAPTRGSTDSSVSGSNGGDVQVGDCVEIEGSSVEPRSCDLQNDGQVVAEVNAPPECGRDTRVVTLPAESRVLCIAG